MTMNLEPRDLGIFEPSDFEVLASVFNALCAKHHVQADGRRSEALARSLLKVYRHGIHDAARLTALFEPGDGAGHGRFPMAGGPARQTL